VWAFPPRLQHEQDMKDAAAVAAARRRSACAPPLSLSLSLSHVVGVSRAGGGAGHALRVWV
jgi:hypothetical protein